VKKFTGLCCALLLLIGGNVAAQKPSLGEQARVVKFDELAKMMSQENDTTYLFNFFATWCEPCVKEFPAFQRFSARYVGKKTRLVFVSLDFKRDFSKRLLPFLKKNHVKNEVVLLDEPDYNSWIDRVDTTWDGNLPATLVMNNGKHIHRMFARDFTYASLETAMKPFLP
jgi:thiol-disulfide isomerase/thioredoxin